MMFDVEHAMRMNDMSTDLPEDPFKKEEREYCLVYTDIFGAPEIQLKVPICQTYRPELFYLNGATTDEEIKNETQILKNCIDAEKTKYKELKKLEKDYEKQLEIDTKYLEVLKWKMEEYQLEVSESDVTYAMAPSSALMMQIEELMMAYNDDNYCVEYIDSQLWLYIDEAIAMYNGAVAYY